MNVRDLRMAVFAVALLGLVGSAAPGQDRGPVLPERCSDGELVVSRGAGRFECAALRDVLGMRFCSGGDLVTVDAFGRLECVSPPKERDTGALPSCSIGETLVSEGSGRWGCASRP